MDTEIGIPHNFHKSSIITYLLICFQPITNVNTILSLQATQE